MENITLLWRGDVSGRGPSLNPVLNHFRGPVFGDKWRPNKPRLRYFQVSAGSTSSIKLCPSRTRVSFGIIRCRQRTAVSGLTSHYWVFQNHGTNSITPPSIFFFFFFTLSLSSFWTSRGHMCRPFSPPGSCSFFFFSFFFILRRMGSKNKSLSTPHFHVILYTPCIRLSQIIMFAIQR